jgi:hypothetical protein
VFRLGVKILKVKRELMRRVLVKERAGVGVVGVSGTGTGGGGGGVGGRSGGVMGTEMAGRMGMVAGWLATARA